MTAAPAPANHPRRPRTPVGNRRKSVDKGLAQALVCARTIAEFHRAIRIVTGLP